MSLERRRGDEGDTLFVFNESWSPHTARLRFTKPGGTLTLWNPASGEQRILRDHVAIGDVVALDLGAAQSLLLTLLPAS